MADLIHTHSEHVRGTDGVTYEAQSWGEERDDGTWIGWLVFHAADGAALRTERETTQPDRAAVEYWAGGLERVYLEGALGRARERA